MLTPTRGKWHRRTERGPAPPLVQGAGSYPCSLCGKHFVSAEAVSMHEAAKHKEEIHEELLKISHISQRSFDRTTQRFGEALKRLADK